MRGQKGITLVALIITIIVMLILVAVSVGIAVQSDLFGKAQSAGQDWKNAEDEVKYVVNNVTLTEDGQPVENVQGIQGIVDHYTPTAE